MYRIMNPPWSPWLPLKPQPLTNCLFVFERGTGRKVAVTAVAHFSHPGQIQPLTRPIPDNNLASPQGWSVQSSGVSRRGSAPPRTLRRLLLPKLSAKQNGWQLSRCQPSSPPNPGTPLPASAAMEAAATVKTSTMNCGRSVKSAPCHRRTVETADSTARYISVSAIPRATPARVSIPRTTIPSVSIAPVPQPARTVEPWARADEDAAREPVCTVVAVRSARVRSVSVIAIRTDRRCANCYSDRTHSDSHAHLRLRVRQWNHQHRQHRNIFQVTHNHLPLPVRSPRSDSEAFQILYRFERWRHEKVAKIWSG